jgi:cytochrome P450
MMTREFTPSYDPLIPHPDHVKDPYKVYKELRDNAPVYRSPHGVWIMSRAKEVADVLKSSSFGRGYFYFENMAKRMGESIVKQPVYDSARNMMVMKDGPEHIKLRKIVINSFNNKAVSSLQPIITHIVDNIVSKALEKQQFDLVADIAYQIPQQVMCHMLGIPKSDWHKFSQRAANGSRALEPAPLSPIELMKQNKAVEESREYFKWLVDYRRKNRGDDLTTTLIDAADNEGLITAEELVDNLRMTLIGGIETTVSTIGNGLIALYQNPSQLSMLRQDMSLMSDTVNEIIRFNSSVQMTPRQAREDVTLEGVNIAAGETILCIIASANRDETIWQQPDEFLINRPYFPSFSFGGGPHRCLGAGLAQAEVETALTAILTRMPALKFDHENPQWIDESVVFRGLKSLPCSL